MKRGRSIVRHCLDGTNIVGLDVRVGQSSVDRIVTTTRNEFDGYRISFLWQQRLKLGKKIRREDALIRNRKCRDRWELFHVNTVLSLRGIVRPWFLCRCDVSSFGNFQFCSAAAALIELTPFI